MTVEVLRLTKQFGSGGEVTAASDVSFIAPDAAMTALLGPSGSGKSTVLRLVAGLELPDRGTITIAGRDVTRVAPRDRGIGFVFQSYALFRHMTVTENVAFGLIVRRAPRSEIDARVAELLALVQLSGYERRRPDELSGGQRQRVALARALASKPRVLLLDEPFGALDARVRHELRESLHELHERTRVTTVLVTHDREEAFELASHVVLMREGRVEQAGSPSALYDAPATPFVASFIGGASKLHRGAEGDVYVRPHDVDLRRPAPTQAPPAGERLARIERLTQVGGWVKLVVAVPSGEHVAVHLSRRELEERKLAPGDEVLVELSETKVFPPDYAI